MTAMTEDRLYLIHISECIERIEQYTVEGKDAFFADTKTQDAVVRNLQVLAESTKNLSDSLKAVHPDVDWQGIVGFRNILVHYYLGVNMARVWEIVERNVPELKTKIETIQD